MIRAAEGRDKQSWIKLNRDFMDFEIQDDNLWNHIDKAEEDDLGAVFDEALKNPQHITIFMIENDGEVIGFANLMTIFSVWAKGRALIIDDLYIDSRFQGRGYGRQAMKEIEDYARKSGYERVQFQSEETNPGAKAFYMALGYEPAAMSFYVRYL